jgi:hypothetical protein
MKEGDQLREVHEEGRWFLSLQLEESIAIVSPSERIPTAGLTFLLSS